MSVKSCETRTKRDLDGVLRQLLAEKELDQIRVRELTELCAIRRQSFYYHFPDVYALFDWSLQREREQLIARQDFCLTWQQAVKDLLLHTAENRAYYQALLKNRGSAGLQEVLGEPVRCVVGKLMEYYGPRCGGRPDDQKELSRTEWLKMMMLVLFEGWIRKDLKQEPEEIVAFLSESVYRTIIGAAWENAYQQGL